ncbi:glycosyltransferase [Vibrio parahaemolyticus]|nr:glycosyltransferase [Vibrio parahaemolyticus]EJE8522925.1 glycosyltransferase [Vibrio parahaemolyticus]ELS9501680.1 glycosyltransferase [Vibrio parahaemolyticus]MBE3877689.1 glycosyltransferase [Vibrio parahaemolyticus]MBE3970083.1 glycosyltransferase [Vibrio parahaemolyticus]
MNMNLSSSDIELIEKSGLFDAGFYALNCPDLLESGKAPTEDHYKNHFYNHGFFEFRRPNAYFDPHFYQNEYEDVLASGMHPLMHYIHHGSKEHRNPCKEFDAEYYANQVGEELRRFNLDPLYHYLHFGFARNLPINSSQSSQRFMAGREAKCDYESWLEVNQWNSNREFLLREKLAKCTKRPLLSLVMPVYNPPVKFFKKAIQSVLAQVYGNWELCIADDCSTNPEVKLLLEEMQKIDSRIKVTFRESNGHISAATNSAAEIASGEILVFMDQDDEITPDALAEIALYMDANPTADVIYSDDDKIDVQGKRFAPQFKPDWSPELLLSYMYFGHIFSVSRELYWKVGGTRVGFEGSQDYDLALRVTEKASHVGHIPKVLYHWRVLPGSTAASGDEKNYSFQTGINAVQDALDRRNVNALVHQPSWALEAKAGLFEHSFGDSGPSVAIIIPTKNQAEILSRLLVSLQKTTYDNYKVYIVNNDSDDHDTLELLASCGHEVFDISNPSDGFSFAHINNQAVKCVAEDYVLFLNNDTEVLNGQWLSQLMGYVQLDGVGVAGARLLYPDDYSTQHAGVVQNLHHGLPGHGLKVLEYHNGGYMSRAKVAGNFSGVTAACMVMRRSLFSDLNGFDEEHFAVAYNDADLCLRVQEHGYRIAYVPSAELLHHESKSRGNKDNPQEELNYLSRYGGFVDSYYNPNLRNEMPSHLAVGRFVGETVKEPTRVGFVSHNLNLEGAPIQLKEIAQGFIDHPLITPVFICQKEEGPLKEELADLGIETITIADDLIGELVGDYGNVIHDVKAWLQKNRIDVVVSNTILNFWAVDAAERAGIPAIWVIHESEPPFSHISYWCEAAKVAAFTALEKAYQVVFVSEATRGLYAPLAPKQNLSVVYNGFNNELAKSRLFHEKADARSKLSIADDEVFVISVGTVCPRKGQLDFIKAIEHLETHNPNQKLKFAIIGDRDSDYSQAIHTYCSQLPEDLQQRITIISETKDVGVYFSAADIFVCTSLIESFPKVIQEAMFSGLAIVTTPVFGIAEQLKHDVSAKFFKPKDYVELSQNLLLLTENAIERERLASNARLHLKRLPNYQDMINEYESLIFEAVQ